MVVLVPALRRSDGVIIGGDFNTVPFSRAIRSMGRRYEDALWPSVDYFTGTYSMVKFPFKPRIDYIFHSGGMRVMAAGVIRDGGGDQEGYRRWLMEGVEELVALGKAHDGCGIRTAKWS
jgi:endonuclease/exonuclease/phosphatase family metal-dependent hydrolase